MSCRWKQFKRCIVLTATLKVWKFIRDEIGLGHKFILSTRWYRNLQMDFKDLMDGYESVSRDFPLPLFHFYFTRKDETRIKMPKWNVSQMGKLILWFYNSCEVGVCSFLPVIIECWALWTIAHQLRGRVGQ
jgi:ATP-dependent DNA helicase RecG